MRRGVLYAVIAYLAWGLLPLYWNVFAAMGSLEILAHRIVWSFVFVGLLLGVTRRWRQMRGAMAGTKGKIAMMLCSLFICANWLIYIWAVNHGKVMETSLGYYMNPLLSVLFGVVFLKEKLKLGQWVALGLAAAGVLYITFQYGEFPWVAISLALSFALYGLTKKQLQADALSGVAWETLLVVPISILYLSILQGNNTATAWAMEGWQIALLMLAGVVTALPLLWFAEATKYLPLSTIGFIQYLSPTISLLSAVFLFGEAFTTSHLISFSLIWAALVVYTASSLRKKPQSAPLRTNPS
ncbi:EamA family transporter RarD [Brevibacillus panacihumi]|uniref:EamA family transporter RarD n=1 Tax=Brevibacillus panacihumi TaxID=497735 RepID=A0A3M8CYX7_9BACL|nr:EamA family transporter RarD [Brevibacillus panacihumi]RNB80848.1 EamA family transporter RarD [Brevibacillus panacihumi]